MKTWQAVLASAVVLSASYMLSAHAKQPDAAGKWGLAASAPGTAFVWNEGSGQVFFCRSADAVCFAIPHS